MRFHMVQAYSSKAVSVLVSIIIVLAFLVMPVNAAEAPDIQIYNENVAKIAQEIEEKYNIDITYPIRKSGYAAVGAQTLRTLEQSLEYISPELVSEISNYYKKTTNSKQRICVSFEYPPLSLSESLLASFNTKEGRLRIFIPSSDGGMLISGTNPSAIVHEMGHAFHELAAAGYGEESLASKWDSYNGKYSYSSGDLKNLDESVFPSPYACSSYNEDFAEVFARAFTANRAGLGISHNLSNSEGKVTGYGKKMLLLKTLISDYVTNNEKALANIEKIYSTPRYLTFGDIKMSGVSLQYIGFAEPNGVYAAIEKSLNIKTANSYWIKEIGGWYVESTKGNKWYAFPGGDCLPINSINPS